MERTTERKAPELVISPSRRRSAASRCVRGLVRKDIRVKNLASENDQKLERVSARVIATERIDFFGVTA